MREVISLHLGQCGNQIASAFWKNISKEHGINVQGNYSGLRPQDELRYATVFFRENFKNKYTPRAVLIDTEPSVVDSILKDCDFKAFYAPQNVVLRNSGSGNSWATGQVTCFSVRDVFRL